MLIGKEGAHDHKLMRQATMQLIEDREERRIVAMLPAICLLQRLLRSIVHSALA
jgi:hypothetical protein